MFVDHLVQCDPVIKVCRFYHNPVTTSTTTIDDGHDDLESMPSILPSLPLTIPVEVGWQEEKKSLFSAGSSSSEEL